MLFPFFIHGTEVLIVDVCAMGSKKKGKKTTAGKEDHTRPTVG